MSSSDRHLVTCARPPQSFFKPAAPKPAAAGGNAAAATPGGAGAATPSCSTQLGGSLGAGGTSAQPGAVATGTTTVKKPGRSFFSVKPAHEM